MTRRLAAVAAAGVVSGGVATGLASGVPRAEAPLPSLGAELAREVGVDPSSVRELFAAGRGEGRAPVARGPAILGPILPKQ